MTELLWFLAGACTGAAWPVYRLIRSARLDREIATMVDKVHDQAMRMRDQFSSN